MPSCPAIVAISGRDAISPMSAPSPASEMPAATTTGPITHTCASGNR